MDNTTLKALAVAAALLTAGPAPAATVNLVADGGWSRFAFGDAGTSVGRNFSFTIAAKAILTVVDGFFAGDRFEVSPIQYRSGQPLPRRQAPSISG